MYLFQGHNASGDSRWRNSRSYYLYQKSASCCPKIWKWNFWVATGSFNRMAPSLIRHHLTQQWCRENFPSFLDNDCCLRNSPDLNPLDHSIWDELVNTINWNKVKWKATLIQQLKSSFKNIGESFVFESCTNRLYRMSQNDGNYLR